VMRLFGSNGVRGVANEEFTPQLAAAVAASAGHLLGREMALGRDGRTTSPMFRDVVASALLSVGCNVYDFGEIPTPALQYMVKSKGFDGGIMVTASHNPPEFNGLKVIYGDGVEVPRFLEERIEALVSQGGPEPVAWNQVGRVTHLEFLEEYVEAVVSHVDAEAIRGAGLSVALDLGNGVASLTAPKVAARLGCRVYTLNEDIDGEFPGRGSEPTPENLGGLRALIKATGASMGVGFDGDGDRSIVMDEKGEAVWGDRTLSLVAQEYLKEHPGETIVTPVSSSNSLEEVVSRYGGKVYWTRVGSVVVSRTMVDNGFNLGGEENGGIMYGPFLPVRDGCMTMALLLEIMARRGTSLSRLIAEQPRLYKGKTKTPCPNHLKEKALERLAQGVKAAQVNTLDGVKITYEDGSWVLFRPSGTEPIFRVYAEAAQRSRVKELLDQHVALIEKVVSELASA